MSLFKYLASRVGTYLLVLLIGITIIFILPRLMPSDPIDDLAEAELRLDRLGVLVGRDLESQILADADHATVGAEYLGDDAADALLAAHLDETVDHLPAQAVAIDALFG